MRDVSDKSCKENQNTFFMFNNYFPKIVYEIMWKNMEGPDRQQIIQGVSKRALQL